MPSSTFETECIPACKTCVDAGSCDKIWIARPKPAASYSKNHYKQVAAREKELSGHWLMPCGHHTNHQEQELYRYWKPKSKDWYCDNCNKWQKKPPKKRTSRRIATREDKVPF